MEIITLQINIGYMERRYALNFEETLGEDIISLNLSGYE